MDFDDLYQNNRKRGLSQSKRIRFCCIFLIVAALTGFILWKTIPRSAAVQESVPSVRENQTGKETAEQADKKQPFTPSVQPEPEKKSKNKPSVSENKSFPTPSTVKDAEQLRKNPKGIAAPADLPEQFDRPVIPQEPLLGVDLNKRIENLENQFKNKNFTAASRGGEALLNSLTAGSEPYRQVLKIVTEANWQRFLNRDITEGFGVRYTVVSGDSLGVIARKHKTTIAAVVKANNLKRAGLIQIGQKLTLLSGSWKITVSKSKRLLLLHRNNKIFAGFDVGIGRFGKTPSADFVIAERLKHPVYRTGDGRIFKYGEDGNQLGDYFLKLASVGSPGRPLLGYGIHGTPDETTVTRSLSNGCIRMRNSDVEKLYYLVPAGVPVGIRD